MTKFFDKVAVVLVYSSQMNFEVHACMVVVDLNVCALELIRISVEQHLCDRDREENRTLCVEVVLCACHCAWCMFS